MTISMPSSVTLYTTPPAETGYSILSLDANAVPHKEELVCWHILFLLFSNVKAKWDWVKRIRRGLRLMV